MATENYTPREMMVVSAARMIRDREIVFVGMRMPLLAFNLAKSLWAPEATALYEAGLMREKQCVEYFHTMCDLPLQTRASWLTGLVEVMSCLQRGEVDVGIIGGAQIDVHGNVNSTLVKTALGVKRLPGSGGACDIAVFAKRMVVMMPMESRRMVPKVDYITSPAGGGRNREKPAKEVYLVTDKAVLSVDGSRFTAVAVYPEVSKQQIADVLNGSVAGLDKAPVQQPPSEEELRVLRALDREGFWTRQPNKSKSDIS
ncbi:MAG: CoA-transferase [Candidatus Caldarchaeum sp.]|uniref:CoA transferase n=1 Tax=Caldiarchaeum subterraneum TaxID=311458 RepID=A0A7C5Q4X0_CALS0